MLQFKFYYKYQFDVFTIVLVQWINSGVTLESKITEIKHVPTFF